MANIVLINVEHAQVLNEPLFVDKLQKWIVDIKAEDEGIKIVLVLRDANERNVFREGEEIREVVGEGVFEDDLSAVIMLEDLRDCTEEERKETIQIVNQEIFEVIEQIRKEGLQEKFTVNAYTNNFLGRARDAENSIVFDGYSDAEGIRKSMGHLLKQSIRLEEGMFDIPKFDMDKVFEEHQGTVTVESSVCSVIDL